ncbi:putative MFS family arabinose efflux permease [Kitasatospora sp. SolWspMP-SS2h]|uniref:MFS transporter n=1 Tax=Kitasatospora sp. SolWspMP-SS2h TaxID=1305729 RepID=UPI000DB98979|nr:MFS transporter [Kitasatospora sp. SolWspMP-SS2h]RAJ33208.1 putative MFS family arabinose efflux permease [Kitasatospora sp. SolWspMP-SS2h]
MTGRRLLLDVAPLRESPAFRRLWLGGTVSGLGGQMALVAVVFQVWEHTRSTVWTGAVGLAQAVPLLVLGLFAGALVDRSDRRTPYLLATAGQAGCALLLAAQAPLGYLPPAGVVALVAGQSVFVAVAGPAARTFPPRLLPPGQLAAGLALNRVAFQGAMLLGPALGGLLVAWAGVGGCYLADALSFAAALYATLRLPRMRPDAAPGTARAGRAGLRDVRDGLAFLARTPVVRAALLTDLAATVLSMPISLFPLVNAERFDGGPRTLGLFLTAIAAGGVAASVLSGAFTRRPHQAPVMLAAAAAWGVALALFGLVSSPWPGLGLLVLAGAADTVSVVARGTVVQLHTPDALLGRVGAAEQVVGQAGPDLGNLRGGLVASATSGTTALISGGLLCLAAVALIGTATPGLRRPPDPGEIRCTP